MPAPLVEALGRTGIPESHIGFLVQDLASSQTLIAHGQDRPLNPASVMKLLTTLATLDRLGPAHVWTTRVWLEGPVRDGTLEGNLVLQGGGDPGLTPERFWLLLREIHHRGIQRIQGDVILDNGFYDLPPQDPGDFDQAPGRAYNAPPAALLVGHNVLGTWLKPDGETVQVSTDPPLPSLKSQLRALPDLPCEDWHDGIHLTRPEDGVRLEGVYPLACGERQTWLNLLSPEDQAALWFRKVWGEIGGTLAGTVKGGRASPDARLLLGLDSQPLGRLVQDVNEYSNNVMAKMLFLNLGAHTQSPPATWKKGEDSLRTWLLDHGLCLPELVVENGAGLSRLERISATSLARLLGHAATLPVFHEFLASLAILGREGTLRRRLTDTPLAGRAWLKTGTLNGVRNLAGYVRDDQGRMKIFVLLINHPLASRSGPVQEAALHWAMYPPTSLPKGQQ